MGISMRDTVATSMLVAMMAAFFMVVAPYSSAVIAQPIDIDCEKAEYKGYCEAREESKQISSIADDMREKYGANEKLYFTFKGQKYLINPNRKRGGYSLVPAGNDVYGLFEDELEELYEKRYQLWTDRQNNYDNITFEHKGIEWMIILDGDDESFKFGKKDEFVRDPQKPYKHVYEIPNEIQNEAAERAGQLWENRVNDNDNITFRLIPDGPMWTIVSLVAKNKEGAKVKEGYKLYVEGVKDHVFGMYSGTLEEAAESGRMSKEEVERLLKMAEAAAAAKSESHAKNGKADAVPAPQPPVEARSAEQNFDSERANNEKSGQAEAAFDKNKKGSSAASEQLNLDYSTAIPLPNEQEASVPKTGQEKSAEPVKADKAEKSESPNKKETFVMKILKWIFKR